MKFTFIGSHHMEFASNFIKDATGADVYFIEIKEGISSFLEENIGIYTFYDEISNSDFIFIDMLADKDLIYQGSDQLVENEYQKLIWHICSATYGAKINIINTLRYDIIHMHPFMNFLSKINLRNCNLLMPEGVESFFGERELFLNNTIKNLFGEGFNPSFRSPSKKEPPEPPDVVPFGEGREKREKLSSIIDKLKSKKEFETK